MKIDNHTPTSPASEAQVTIAELESIESIAIKETVKSILNDEEIVLEHRDHTNHSNATVH